MALTDTFVKSIKPTAASAGDKHSDGHGLYLLVKPAGKYWRMNYRFQGKQKTLSLGVYPAVSLAKARQKRENARVLLAEGMDPSAAKREAKMADLEAAQHTFMAIAERWLTATAANRAPITQGKVTAWLSKDIVPFIGNMPITTIGPRDVLNLVRKMEARGSLDSAKRISQLCSQIFRYAVAEGTAARDVTVDLKGAFKQGKKSHYAAITEPAKLGELLRSIDAYTGHVYCRSALLLAPLVFVRPGELRTAEWEEIDVAAAEWRIPGRKMKMGHDHVVPLSTQAIEVLQGLHPITGHGQCVPKHTNR